jgi:mutator protein MutT
MKKYQATWLILRRGNEILLAMKKRGFGEGKFNGVGGKIESGETAEQAAIRETYEEISVMPTKYEAVGELVFDEYVKGERAKMTVYLFVATEWDGEPAESEEMKPKWFAIDKLPYEKMLPDDIHWLPQVLAGKKVTGKFKFGEDFNLISYDVKEAEK